MKPRIFIGSSTEGLKVAEYIKLNLSEFDCFLWTDDIFKANQGTLETLLKVASVYDFGILVATSDDWTKSRNVDFDTPRDNIILEFGLFLGRVGINKAFIIQEKGTKFPSDLLGITFPRFEKTGDLTQSKSLNHEIENLKQAIKERYSQYELGLLPSTALSMGYFYNFISLVCDTLQRSKELEVDGKKYSNIRFNIVIPEDIDDNMNKSAAIFSEKHKLRQVSLSASGRNYPVYVSVSDNDDSELHIYDLPTTLNSIGKAINLYMRESHVGKSTEKKQLILKELNNFQRVLESLIKEDAFCQKYVTILSEKSTK